MALRAGRGGTYLRPRLLRPLSLRRLMALPARGLALPVFAVLCLATAADTAAQIGTAPGLRLPSARAALASPRPALDEGLALGGPVDPAEYLVGPGDVFTVSVGGSVPRQTTAAVTADGLLVIAEAGTFQAAGRSLAAVRSEARAALDRQYRNVPTDVALAVPRQFSVFVSGAVLLPGRQTVSALGRIEDALDATTGETLTPLDLADYATPPRFEVERRPALRNVVVTGRGGAEARVDLMRYYATGDLAYNPLLRDGDAVHVPTFDPAREGVPVSGAVDRPGIYDWRPGDTAAALVAVAAGGDLGGRVAAVRRTRVVAGRPQSVEVGLAEAGSLDVLPRDQVSVVAAEPDAGYASAVGALAFPGTYPIRSGATTLADLVDAAGGLAPDALARGAYLERTARAQPEAALDPLLAPSPRPLSQARLDSALTDLGTLSDLGLVSRRYYLTETLGASRVAADLDGGGAVRLLDGDRLVVPRDLGAVRLTGQVAQPGYVPFVEGRTAADYVAEAGGLGPAAETVYVVDARTGRLTAGAATPVLRGDAVFVDRTATSDSPQIESLAIQERREEREVRQQRQTLLLQTVQVTATVLSAIGTLYLLVTQ